MNNDRNNYDVASISQPGKDKRANFVRNALQIEKKSLKTSGQFVKVFADMFLRKEAGNKAII